jgi:hypothetical protein
MNDIHRDRRIKLHVDRFICVDNNHRVTNRP